MDFESKTNNIITRLNTMERNRENLAEFIPIVCEYFDLASNESKLSQQNISLLYYLANLIGVPQYFDLFAKIKGIERFDEISSQLLFGSLVKESNLYINQNEKLHVFQKEIVDKFDKDNINRYIISAPTSFGKTFIIYYLIEKMKYKNAALIFPTIALLSENLTRIISLKKHSLLERYKIITLSDEKIEENGNILVLTPERFMTFVDKNKNVNFNFMFYDEIYKIDNAFTNDDSYEEFEEKTQDHERDIAFRIALEMGIRRAEDILLAGPFLSYADSVTINNFMLDNNFTPLNYNAIELVNKNNYNYKEIKNKKVGNWYFSTAKNETETDKIASVLNQLKYEESIVYCQSKQMAEYYALEISKKKIYNSPPPDDRFKKLIKHLKNRYSPEWCLVKVLKNGIGIHHGTIPKYLQKEVIDLFNKGIIKCLFSTTTITEGVNTTVKNMIIHSYKKGLKKLKKFDVLNIQGRAGRFSKHFTGRVFIINEKINEILNLKDDILRHINYGENTIKSDLDLEITQEKYLSEKDRHYKSEIWREYEKNKVPLEIIKSFLTLSPKEKVTVYRYIINSYNVDKNEFAELIKAFTPGKFNVNKIQYLINILKLFIEKDDKLYKYINNKYDGYSVISFMLLTYLTKGFFNGTLKYKKDKRKQKESIDSIIRKAHHEVYNIFRYELVKHISLIDYIYRYIVSVKEKTDPDNINGFGYLLSYLEYGATTPEGKKASDFGLPSNVVMYIERKGKIMDDYERILYDEYKLLE